MLAGIYALAITLTRSRAAAIAATLLYTTQLNNWTLGSPSPYLNFFHHGLPYTYAMIVWSMLFFFRGRYSAALLLTGLSYNFHPMCTLFLLCAYSLYWLLNRQNFSARLTLTCLAAFALPAMPGITKTVAHAGAGGSTELWLEGVRWVASYTCNPSTWSLWQFLNVGLFLVLSGASVFAFPKRDIRKTVLIFWSAVAIMCFVGTVFADIIPVPLIIKLSLWRSTVIYLYLAIIFIAWACIHVARKSSVHALMSIMLIILLTGYIPHIPQFYLCLFLPAFLYALFEQKSGSPSRISVLLAGCTSFLICALCFMFIPNGIWIVACALALFLTTIITSSLPMPRYGTLIIWAIALLIFDAAVLTAQGGPKIYYRGCIQGARDPWADIQLAARELSHKDDLFIVPPLRNDFYHYSFRAVLGDWSEGSTLLYLDNRYTEEWFERMHDLGWTKPHNAEAGFNSLSTADIIRVGRKYNAGFVVTERPKTFELPRVYANSRFMLYRIPLNSDQ
jgi:hypothetical protein